MKDRKLRPCKKDVVFKHKFFLKFPLEYAYHNLITFEALGDVPTEKEISAEYGIGYSFTA